MTLPCLTLHDPWASLCVAGIKTLETRKGPALSGFTGPLVIHRSLATCSGDLYSIHAHWGLTLPERPAGWPNDDRGMALGVVYVDGTSRPGAWGVFQQRAHLQRRACFLDIDERYLSELTQAAWFPAPIPARGQQGRWKIDVPNDYVPEWAT